MVYATVLKGYIDGIVTSQCFGCMVGVADLHTTCLDRKDNVRDYFKDAMNTINETDVLALIKKKVGKCPSKAILRANTTWCDEVKDIIISLYL